MRSGMGPTQDSLPTIAVRTVGRGGRRAVATWQLTATARWPGFPIPGNSACIGVSARGRRPLRTALASWARTGSYRADQRLALLRRFGGLVARLGVAFGQPLARARGAVVRRSLARYGSLIGAATRDGGYAGGTPTAKLAARASPIGRGLFIDLPAFSGGSRSGRHRCRFSAPRWINGSAGSGSVRSDR
jgi:hypothetical protein